MKLSNFPGISPLANDTTQKYLLKTQSELTAQNLKLKTICIILFVVTCFNTMFAVGLVYRNAIMGQENLQLIQENQVLIGFQQFMFRAYSAAELNDKNVFSDTEKFARMIDFRVDCPPCTTEKPSVVEPHKNPVSILNELTDPKHIAYDCAHTCVNPPIHFSTLMMNDPQFPSKNFTGKGVSKQQSKQVAAYRALEFFYPDMLVQIPDDNKPNLGYSPLCNDPSKINDRAKC